MERNMTVVLQRITRAALTMFAAMAIAFAVPGFAASLQMPAEKPILTITGKIGVTNKDGSAQFDRAMLESIGMVSFETTTPWFNGLVKFEGVLMDKLLQRVEASGQRLTVTALNDYSSELPIEDFAKYGVILALKRNGQYMPVSDKGPLFIVYPFDTNPELKNQKFYSRSVWQINRIDVK
jgi:hypothetical protein